MLLQGHPELLEGFTKLVPEMVFLARAYLPASSTSSGDQVCIISSQDVQIIRNVDISWSHPCVFEPYSGHM